ncbi:MAG: alpha/beta fold hydrolase [bacterium]|nr:alpha/beta fold hydrolase [bacterium]
MKSEFTFASSNGHDTIAAYQWLPEGEPSAVIQLAHGMTEYMKNYEEFARFLTASGFAVVGMDYIGHGMTASDNKELGHFLHYDSSEFLILDIRTLALYVKNTFPGKKHILLGHSFGSFLGRIYASRYLDFNGLVLVGTGMLNMKHIDRVLRLIEIRKKHHGGRDRSRLVQGYAFAKQVKKFLPMKTNFDWTTRDKNKIKEYASDYRNNYVFTLHGFYTLFKTVVKSQENSVIENTPDNLPILIISGGNDAVGHFGKGPRRLFELLCSGGKTKASLKLYQDARHSLLQETNRAEVFRYIADWCRYAVK